MTLAKRTAAKYSSMPAMTAWAGCFIVCPFCRGVRPVQPTGHLMPRVGHRDGTEDHPPGRIPGHEGTELCRSGPEGGLRNLA